MGSCSGRDGVAKRANVLVRQQATYESTSGDGSEDRAWVSPATRAARNVAR
jgi:hypothetical protein